MLKNFTLKNGIKVATYNLPQIRSIHIRISNKCGSLVETQDNNGIAHFMEHLLVQGIPSYPTSEKLSEYIESLAGSYSAYTENLLIGFGLTVPATYLETAIKITSEVFFKPLFLESAVEKERQVILNEISQKMDSHFYKITEFSLETRFSKNHPLTLLPGGSLEVVKKITREDLINFWKKYFIPKNSYIFIIGNFDDQILKNQLEKFFEEKTEDINLPGYPKVSNQDFSKRQIWIRTDRKLSTCYMDLTFPSMNLNHPLELRLKQRLALIILGQLRNSRLFRLLRYQKGLVYNVSSGSSTIPGLGYVYINSEISPANLDEVIDLISKELFSYIKSGPTQEEIEFAKNYLTNQWLMSFDHPSSIASWVEDDLLWEDKILLPEDYAKLIKEVKVEDIVEVMKKYWDFSKLNLTIQGPLSNSVKNIQKYTSLIKKL